MERRVRSGGIGKNKDRWQFRLDRSLRWGLRWPCARFLETTLPFGVVKVKIWCVCTILSTNEAGWMGLPRLELRERVGRRRFFHWRHRVERDRRSCVVLLCGSVEVCREVAVWARRDGGERRLLPRFAVEKRLVPFEVLAGTARQRITVNDGKVG